MANERLSVNGGVWNQEYKDYNNNNNNNNIVSSIVIQYL